MGILLPLSRRALLRTGGSFVAAAGVLDFGTATRAQQRIAKSEAKYQDRPNGIQHCEICLQFQLPNRCQLVQGDISPNGWCQFFAAKENAQ
jgi:hypothetical protein